MKNQLSISKYEALNEQELRNTNGGLLVLMVTSAIIPGLLCLAIYGAFMEGYNDGRAAALGGN